MRRLFVSDTHIGDPTSQYLKAFLTIEQEKPDELYLIGDIFDLWRMPLNKLVQRHNEAFVFLQELSVKIKIVYILGNHDDQIDKKLPYFQNIEFATSKILNSGKKIKLLHGHQYDKSVFNFYPLSRFIAIFQTFLYNLLGIDIRRFRFSLASHKYGKFYQNALEEIRKKATEESEGANAVIIGHTHMPEKSLVKNVEFINCGDWLDSNSYVVEDNGVFSLRYGGYAPSASI